MLSGGDHGDDLAAALTAAQNEINTLRALTPQEGVRVTVPQSGIFSGQVDGYETVLVPEITEGVTPSLLDSLESRAVEEDSSALGKLITNSQWYFIFSLGEEQAKRLTVGRAVPVRFSRERPCGGGPLHPQIFVGDHPPAPADGGADF